jgi:hypothetical protein
MGELRSLLIPLLTCMIFAVSAASPSLAAVDAEASSKDPVVIDVDLPTMSES